MFDACFIMLVLSGISLVIQLGMSFYTLSLSKKAEHHFYMDGYIDGLCANYNKQVKEEGESNDD